MIDLHDGPRVLQIQKVFNGHAAIRPLTDWPGRQEREDGLRALLMAEVPPNHVVTRERYVWSWNFGLKGWCCRAEFHVEPVTVSTEIHHHGGESP